MDEFYNLFYDQIFNIVSFLPICIDQEYGVELSGSVTQDTYSLDLFVTFGKIDGIRKHHSKMIAEGLFSQKNYDEFTSTIAEAARKTPVFEKDSVFTFPIEEQSKNSQFSL